MEMKLKCVSVIVVVLSLNSCIVLADPVSMKNSRTSVTLSEIVDIVEKGKVSGSNLKRGGLNVQSKSGIFQDDRIKLNDGVVRADANETKDLSLESKNELKMIQSADVNELCDSSSNSCTDDDKRLLACLRVPGNESPELSLLIQNRGNGSLTITVSAPDFVQLEKKQFELKEKEDTEVKVSINYVNNDHLIILNAGQGNCSLDLKNFASKRKDDPTNNSDTSNSSTRLFLLSATLILLSILSCVKFGTRYLRKKDRKYGNLVDMELPISHGSKLEAGESDGWDNNWGYSWDDEESVKDGIIAHHSKPFIKKS